MVRREVILMDAEFVRDRILELRLKAGISAQNLSVSIGLTENTINKIDRKISYPSWPTFFKICDFFRISAKDFFDTEAPNPARLNELLEEARGLDDETLEHMIGIARKLRVPKK
jgi:DNA-binding XRE family transcriptional regulator